LYREIIDVEIEAKFQRRVYETTQSWDTKRFRVVSILDESADDYHFYITNLSREQFLPRNIVTLYRCRCEVELLFGELKRRCELNEFNAAKKHVVEILAYAALLTLLVSRELLDVENEYAEDEAMFPSERWALTFRSHAQFIFHESVSTLAIHHHH
jgi:IS4 transposase